MVATVVASGDSHDGEHGHATGEAGHDEAPRTIQWPSTLTHWPSISRRLVSRR